MTIDPWATNTYAALPEGMRPRLAVMAVAAAYLGLPKSTFKMMVISGTLPAARWVGICRLWVLEQIDKAVDRLPVDSSCHFNAGN